MHNRAICWVAEHRTPTRGKCCTCILWWSIHEVPLCSGKRLHDPNTATRLRSRHRTHQSSEHIQADAVAHVQRPRSSGLFPTQPSGPQWPRAATVAHGAGIRTTDSTATLFVLWFFHFLFLFFYCKLHYFFVCAVAAAWRNPHPFPLHHCWSLAAWLRASLRRL